MIKKTEIVNEYFRYEAKRQEIESWLLRMESREERMNSTAMAADVLDFSMLESQQKEQKVRDLELNIYDLYNFNHTF